MEEQLMIGNKKYQVKSRELLQANLKFYPENPRVYSLLDIQNSVPQQSEIEEVMCQLEHVKQLKESIKANGGLIDPLLVRDGDFIVLEGNSRLAAYRILNAQDPIKWARVKCIILPSDISDAAIFTLIGQYHIVGRKDWDPYEQAGYLYRRVQTSKQSIEFIAKELGLKISKAENYMKVYKYMLDNNDNHTNKWSYYEELLKNRAIKKYMESVEGLEETIVKTIKENKINKALDIRDYLGGIAKIKDKDSKRVMREIADEKIDIYQGYKRLEEGGKTGEIYTTLKKFRQKITDTEFQKKLQYEEDVNQIKFELSKINKAIESLLKN